MYITKREDIRLVGAYRYTDYQSDNVSEVVDKFKSGLADAVCVAPWFGFKEDSLDCLSRLEGLRAVSIQGFPNFSLEILGQLPYLEQLGIDETKFSLDFALFRKLNVLLIDWHKKLFKNAELSNLTVLALSKYKAATNDLTDFPQFNQLQKLDLTQGTITSLNGISRFSGLSDLALHHLSKLEHLGKLDLPELKKFRAENCKRLVDHEQLGACLNLEIIRMLSAGEMKSVAFVNQLKQLKSFNFLDTEVLDGDLNPLLRLDSVFFTEKKHYSHKVKDFNQMMDGVNVHKAEHE